MDDKKKKHRDTYVLAHPRLAQELEQLELAQRPETEHGMIKRRDLLDGDFAPAGAVDGRADDAVGALADDVEDLVLGAWPGGHVMRFLVRCA